MIFILYLCKPICPLGSQTVKSLPAMQETRVQSLGWEDPLEKEMATHSSNLAWKIPWMEEPGRYSSWGCKEPDMTKQLHFFFFFFKPIRTRIECFSFYSFTSIFDPGIKFPPSANLLHCRRMLPIREAHCVSTIPAKERHLPIMGVSLLAELTGGKLQTYTHRNILGRI